MRPFDVAIIGGGIVGLATAAAILERRRRSMIVLEAEVHLATHQTGHNSGVIHSGLYYAPGSLKARLCSEGRNALYRFCMERGVAHERCGKVVVATRREELPALRDLQRRGISNGLGDLRILTPEEVREHEPHVSCIAGLYVAETGVVDYGQVCEALASRVREGAGEIRTSARVVGCSLDRSHIVLQTTSGEVSCRFLVGCAGLQADRVARMTGQDANVRIIPFRGEYHELARAHLVRHLVYPVPDARLPFLGVHLTRNLHGRLKAGPNALLALKREGYARWSFSPSDTLEMATFGGFWRLVWRYGGTALAELGRSLDRRAFVRSLQRMVPDVRAEDLRFSGTGVRAQAVEANGALVDDFRLARSKNMIHVLNAPSPAATASISIGRAIADMVQEQVG